MNTAAPNPIVFRLALLFLQAVLVIAACSRRPTEGAGHTDSAHAGVGDAPEKVEGIRLASVQIEMPAVPCGISISTFQDTIQIDRRTAGESDLFDDGICRGGGLDPRRTASLVSAALDLIESTRPWRLRFTLESFDTVVRAFAERLQVDAESAAMVRELGEAKHPDFDATRVRAAFLPLLTEPKLYADLAPFFVRIARKPVKIHVPGLLDPAPVFAREAKRLSALGIDTSSKIPWPEAIEVVLSNEPESPAPDRRTERAGIPADATLISAEVQGVLGSCTVGTAVQIEGDDELSVALGVQRGESPRGRATSCSSDEIVIAERFASLVTRAIGLFPAKRRPFIALSLIDKRSVIRPWLEALARAEKLALGPEEPAEILTAELLPIADSFVRTSPSMQGLRTLVSELAFSIAEIRVTDVVSMPYEDYVALPDEVRPFRFPTDGALIFPELRIVLKPETTPVGSAAR